LFQRIFLKGKEDFVRIFFTFQKKIHEKGNKVGFINVSKITSQVGSKDYGID
jgi:hypothetical protein